MKSFFKKIGYVMCLSVFCLSLFSFKSSNKNEMSLTNHVTEASFSSSSRQDLGAAKIVKLVKAAKKAWEKSTRDAVWAIAAIIDGCDCDDEEKLTAEQISKEQQIKIANL